jgi:hypothetical protein
VPFSLKFFCKVLRNTTDYTWGWYCLVVGDRAPLTHVFNKLECLLLPSLSSLIQLLTARQETHTHSGASCWQLLVFDVNFSLKKTLLIISPSCKLYINSGFFFNLIPVTQKQVFIKVPQSLNVFFLMMPLLDKYSDV